VSTTLVTGANGFVGRHLTAQLAKRGVQVKALVRSRGSSDVAAPGIELCEVGDLVTHADYGALMRDVDCVIHLAGRAHVLADRGGRNEDAYRINNEQLTESLAKAAAKEGVRRFVFVSTIKVYGEVDRGKPFTVDDVPDPSDPYGKSKLAAERKLWEICAASDMTGVVVRPPLVYGPGVRANFLRIMRLVDRRIPLPFGAVRNRRSMVAVQNLADLLCVCRDAAAAAGQTFLVTDGRDLSTADLVRELARAMGRKSNLLPVPTSVLRALGALAGLSGEISRLTDSLSLDIAATKSKLGWTPPCSVESGIKATVDAYLQSRGNTP
jgi:UDP-glucose 4-epimerase